MFHSIPEAWKSASGSNMADIKELIPEFFYLSEFLTNSNCFDLGTKQNSEKLDNVILPPWSKGCPMEFIRVHREVQYSCPLTKTISNALICCSVGIRIRLRVCPSSRMDRSDIWIQTTGKGS